MEPQGHKQSAELSSYISKILDILVDWDFDLDKSVIVFFIKPTK
ncbi:hypothetical protein J2Y03_004283 [Neobacillus niacini]|nr:hypothetical protein [Neobacillus niacini]MDR7079225.1 hypothetical protein [Neobacillus niacini]